ncbi:MAG: hypothetical protein OEL75_00490, partial [Kiritimatiellaceae bacterium]|nr:hypothetical protein [Kiritimatiellaceae bacterium]
LTSKMLHTTPHDISIFDSASEVMTASILLVPKALGAYGGSSAMAMYSFDGAPMKGFQMGHPSVNRFVNLSLFDSFDREIHLIVGIDPNASVEVTQDDINTLVFTFSSEL